MTDVPVDSTPRPLTKLADGGRADVYAWDDAHVAKLFRAGVSPRAVQSEFRQAQLVHRLGVPSPLPVRVIEADGRPGILFERCSGPTLYDLVMRHPEHAARHAAVLFELQRGVHGCSVPDGLPTLPARLAARIRRAEGVPDETRARAVERLGALPTGNALCHGDFHPVNIIMTDAGPRILDWSDLAVGDPLADHARTLLLLGFGRPGRVPEATRTGLLEAYTACCRDAFGGRYGTISQWTLPLAVARLAETTDTAERSRLLALLQAAP